MKRENKLLVIILLFSTILRLICLDSRGINYDDAFSIFLSRQNLGSIIQGTAADTMPPLYYFLLHFWMGLSEQLWWLRFLSVLLSLGCGFMLFRIVSELFGANAGLWAALFAGISPFQIYHAQDLRMYTLLGLSQLVYLWFFLRLSDINGAAGNKLLNWVGLVFSGSVAMYTHNLAIFTLIVPDIYLLLKRRWQKLGRLLAAQLIIGVLAIPWLVMIPGQIDKIQRAFWTPRPGFVEVFQVIIIFITNLPLSEILLVLAAVLSLWILVLVSIETWKHRRTNNHLLFWLTILIVPPLLLFLVSYIMRPVFVARAFIVSGLADYGLIGWVVSRSHAKPVKVFIAGSFILASLAALPYFYTYAEFPRSPCKQAMDYLGREIYPGDIVIHDNKLSFFPCHYFAPDLPQVFLADEAGSHNDTLAISSQLALGIFPQANLDQAVGDHRSIYFIVLSRAITEYKQMGQIDHPQLVWLKEKFQLVGHDFFNDLEIYHFVE